MKRSTAVRHLVELADAASDGLRFREGEIGWPLLEVWVTGALLEPVDELEHGSVVLMIDLPPDELSWLAVHPAAEWIGDQLRLGKRPLWWKLPSDRLAAVELPGPASREALVGHQWPRRGD